MSYHLRSNAQIIQKELIDNTASTTIKENQLYMQLHDIIEKI